MHFRIIAIVGIVIGAEACAGFSLTGGPGSVTPKHLQTQVLNSSGLAKVQAVEVTPLNSIPVLSSGELRSIKVLAESVVRSELHLEIVRELDRSSDGRRGEAGAGGALGKENNVPPGARLSTTITAFTDLVGGSFGGDQTAEVGIEVVLVSSSEGLKLWQGSYYFKDQPLSNNWFRIGDRLSGGGAGMRFRTAPQLFEKGYRELIEQLSSDREALFTPK